MRGDKKKQQQKGGRGDGRGGGEEDNDNVDRLIPEWRDKNREKSQLREFSSLNFLDEASPQRGKEPIFKTNDSRGKAPPQQRDQSLIAKKPISTC